MTIVKLSGGDVVEVTDEGDVLEVRQYHVDFMGEGPKIEDKDAQDGARYEIVHPRGRAEMLELERYAHVVFAIGNLLTDRVVDNEHNRDEAVIWEWLFANYDSVYDRLGPYFDELEEAIFG